MKNNNMMEKNINFNELSELTDNFSGSEIEAVVKNAASRSLHEQLSSFKEDIKDADIIVTMNHFINAIEEIMPLFGNGNKEIKKLLPNKIITVTESHKFCEYNCIEYIKKNKRLKTLMIYGENGTGKTTMLAKIATESKIKYIKMIKAIDLISMDEFAKSKYIIDIITNAYLSKDSLILIDDIEITINYANLGNNILFSNKLYQTLLTIFKTVPSNPQNSINIIISCSNSYLVKILRSYFDFTFELNLLDKKEIHNILTLLNNPTYQIQEDKLSIKELLNNIN